MLIAFELTMPGVGSWNGKWTGEGRLYAKVRTLSNTKDSKEKAESIIKKGRFDYDFGDGWRASVKVKKVTPAEAAKIRKNSKGFYGYDWMIDNILEYGKITGY